MAENYNEQVPVSAAPAESVEKTDRGIFDFIKKDHKDEAAEQHQQKPATTTPGVECFAEEFHDKVQVVEPAAEGYKEPEEPKHDSLLDKFHKADDAHSSSSSSSDEEDDEEKKRRKREKKEKKGLKEKIVEKLPGHKDETEKPIEKPHVEEAVYSEPSNPEDVEKKGILGKIKDKLSGDKKVVDEHHDTVATPPVAAESSVEKKGFVEKIKEKIPGFGPKDGEEKKEHE